MQTAMAFYGDQENAVSAALTAVHRLLEKHNLDPRSIGRYGSHHSPVTCHKSFGQRADPMTDAPFALMFEA